MYLVARLKLSTNLHASFVLLGDYATRCREKMRCPVDKPRVCLYNHFSPAKLKSFFQLMADLILYLSPAPPRCNLSIFHAMTAN